MLPPETVVEFGFLLGYIVAFIGAMVSFLALIWASNKLLSLSWKWLIIKNINNLALSGRNIT